MKRASIIICTRNRAGRLKSTIEALETALRDDPTEAEIVLVDNASTDGTPAVIAEFARRRCPGSVIALHEPTPGKSLSLNRGARASTGDILVWLDDDIIPKPGWLAALVRPIQEDKADLVVGRITFPPHLQRAWMTLALREKYGEVPAVNGGTFPVGGNTAASRRFWEMSDGHNSNLGPGVPGIGNGEDTLFARQLVALGARLGYAEDAWVEHHFDKERLQRRHWLQTAESQGRAIAYIFHHWDHATTPLPLIRQWRKRAQLFFWRLRHRPNLDPQSEGISIAELEFVKLISYFQQYRIESRKPHHYDKPQGRLRVKS